MQIDEYTRKNLQDAPRMKSQLKGCFIPQEENDLPTSLAEVLRRAVRRLDGVEGEGGKWGKEETLPRVVPASETRVCRMLNIFILLCFPPFFSMDAHLTVLGFRLVSS